MLIVTSGLSGNAVITRLTGELDVSVIVILREHMERIWDLPAKPFLILDLSGVEFCDSVGMYELIAILQRCEARGTRLLLGGVQGVMVRVLSITGLRNAFEAFTTIDDALRVTSASSPQPATATTATPATPATPATVTTITPVTTAAEGRRGGVGRIRREEGPAGSQGSRDRAASGADPAE
jgi:anti-anti-sigma factor